MRIFIYEFATGGGLLSAAAAHSNQAGDFSGLLGEGAAMVTALAQDFAALPDTAVTILRAHDWQLPGLPGVECRAIRNEFERRAACDELYAAADHTVIIAPECDGILASEVARLDECGGRLLGPGIELVTLASDKHATAEYLARSGVPAPRGHLLKLVRGGAAEIPSIAFPAVLKPCDGAGSQGVQRIDNAQQLRATIAMLHDAAQNDANWRLETFHRGLAVSVALLCGSAGSHALPPCAQHLTDDGKFQYRGGLVPLPADLAERATALAVRAIATLPRPRGYLGVDLVLGSAPDGADDVVIEINPRLTTSYIGLRALARENLAAAMLNVAAGRRPNLSFATHEVEFASDGMIRHIPPPFQRGARGG